MSLPEKTVHAAASLTGAGILGFAFPACDRKTEKGDLLTLHTRNVTCTECIALLVRASEETGEPNGR